MSSLKKNYWRPLGFHFEMFCVTMLLFHLIVFVTFICVTKLVKREWKKKNALSFRNKLLQQNWLVYTDILILSTWLIYWHKTTWFQFFMCYNDEWLCHSFLCNSSEILFLLCSSNVIGTCTTKNDNNENRFASKR